MKRLVMGIDVIHDQFSKEFFLSNPVILVGHGCLPNPTLLKK